MVLKRILITLDTESDQWQDTLIETALNIASPADATVYVLFVFPNEEYDELQSAITVDSRQGTLSPDDLASRLDGMQSLSDQFDTHDIDFEVRGIGGGIPADQIVRKATELDIDLLLVGGKQRSPAGKAVFGDRAQQILLQTPCSVVYVRQDL